MSKISDYILTENKLRNNWRIPEVGGKYSIIGICDGENISRDDAQIIASGVVCIEGEEFILLKKNEDYEAFCQAIKRNIPIIEMWNIKGSERNGYVLTGRSNNQLVKLYNFG